MAEANNESNLWLRHTGEREPRDDWVDSKLKCLTDREIDERLQGQHTVTHMIISDGYTSDHVLERATKLTHLKIVSLWGRDLPQRLSRWMRRLTHLQSLSLHAWEVNSQWPSVLPDSEDWPTWKTLVELEVEGYDFSDGHPPLFMTLNRLHTLTISNCKLKELPDRPAWKSLAELEVERYDFSDGLPSLILSLNQLHTLRISNCELRELPDSIGELTNLEELDLSWNMELETLSESIGNLKSLKKLNVSGCNITSLPENIGELTNLEELDLSQNKRLETLPESIGNLKSLKKLNLYRCVLSSLPESIGELTNLEDLDLSQNMELETLPESIGNLKSLKKLNVYGCVPTSLPESIGELTNLEELDLSWKKELETLPESIGNLKSLKKLDVSWCNLTSLPENIGELTNLEEVDLSWNMELETLPESIGNLKSLKKLYVSGCVLTRLPESIGELTDLEELDLSPNKELETLPESIGNLKSLKKLNVSECNLTGLPESIGELTNLEELDLSRNKELELHESIGNLKSLKKLNVSECNLTGLPESIGELTNLEELDLTLNMELETLPESIGNLKSLKKLNVYGCVPTSLPESIGELTNLEDLDLSWKKELETLPESIGNLKSLKKLNVSRCGLTSLPESIGELTNLEELDLSVNKELETLPKSIGNLKSLKKLNVSMCNLTSLPESIGELTNLEEVDLSQNKELETLPESVGNLKSLKKLNVSGCVLSSLPESVKQLVCLREMHLRENHLETLPWSVFSLPCVERIDLTKNDKLKYLSSSKLEMSRLKKLPKLVLAECNTLRQPPLEICSQGTKAILSYYRAMGKDESCLLSLVTVGVLGESFSGKTSVVKSLKQRRRVLTDRSKTSRKDETTIVFNHETVDIHDGKTDIRFIDLGGNGVYHPTYKLTLKSNFIAALVVDIKRFMDLSIKSGAEEATKRLCFDWLAHFYLANKKLGRPLLVLTHKDKLNADKEQQKKMTNEYRDILLETVARLQRVANMMVFEDKTNSIFEDVFIVGNDDSFDEFRRLLRCIDKRTYEHLYEFPDAWKSMMKTIEDSEKPLLEIEYLKRVFPDSTSLFVMLRFMHRSGRILWLEDLSEDLSSKVFHNIQRVTSTIAILFNHNGSEEWEKRKVEYSAERDEARGGRVGDTEFPLMIYKYQRTGMIDERLLRNLLNKESNIPVEDAVTLMRLFLLIYGPIQEKKDICYAVPYFSTSYQNNKWKYDGDIRLRLSLRLDCPYALPQHAYHQMSLLLASLDRNHCSPLEVKRNGATIYHEGWKTHFIHDHNNSEATLQASTNVEKLTESWTTLRSSVTAILDFLSREWEAVRPRFILYCGSCLLTDQLKPDGRIISFDTSSDEPVGDKTVHCEEEDCQVPASLVKPCYSMTADDLESLRSYINQNLYKSTADGNPVAVPENPDIIGRPTQPTQQEETWEVPRELDDLMKNSADPDIILTPHQTPEYLRENYFNTDQVYPMSGGKRGRALIISNKFSSCLRHGAEQDFINLERMFESFHFDVIGEHKDYTAQEIHDTIMRETQDRRHHRYGMFALVISSHGNDGLVYGTDEHSIRLSDIYGLLSTTKFPAMKGKPKLIIIQSCSGDNMDAPVEQGGNKKKISSIQKRPITVCTDHESAAADRSSQQQEASSRESGEAPGAGSPRQSPTEPNLSMDHLMILKASTPGFGSMRHHRNGSWLIRAICIAFYKHGHWRDLEESCKIAKEQVRLMGIARSRETNDALAQIPELTCYFTNERVVYLFPGYHG